MCRRYGKKHHRYSAPQWDNLKERCAFGQPRSVHTLYLPHILDSFTGLNYKINQLPIEQGNDSTRRKRSKAALLAKLDKYDGRGRTGC